MDEGERGREAELGGPPDARRKSDANALVADHEGKEGDNLTGVSHGCVYGGADPLSFSMGCELLGPGRTSWRNGVPGGQREEATGIDGPNAAPRGIDGAGKGNRAPNQRSEFGWWNGDEWLESMAKEHPPRRSMGFSAHSTGTVSVLHTSFSQYSMGPSVN